MKALEKLYQDALMALQARRFDDAEALFKKFLKRQPSHVGALNLLTITLMSSERFAEAEPFIARALKLDQRSDVSFYNYGLILKRLGRPQEALAQFTSALQRNGAACESWNNRGTVFNYLGQYEQALADFDQAIALNPSYAGAYCNKGRALSELGRPDAALTTYDKALTLNPALVEAWLGKGNACAAAKRDEDAIAAFEKAATLKPDMAVAHSRLGDVQKETGRIDEAREAYARALKLDPDAVPIHYALTQVKRFAPGDVQLAAMEALLLAGTASPEDSPYLEFALGKAYADTGDHARAFQHWQNGNTLKRTQIKYDEAETVALFDDIEAIFTPALIAAKQGHGDPSALPIFVLGMPRSGTTLIEQILASHPDVQAAGEVKILDDVLNTVPSAEGKIVPYPDYVAALAEPAFGGIGARYVAALAKLAPGAARVVDKMPGNFLLAGMIHLALPQATIIHAVRDPVDTCLSCFMQLFAKPHAYAYDLAELGRYYNRYRRLMAHWHRVLPAGTILDVRYEELVADLEGETRRLLAHCNLAWDERCLAFHETQRPVRTASATQVRQPLYVTSVARWRAYEEFLAPLLAELNC